MRALAMAMVLVAAPAVQCPLLIKQLNDQVATFKPDDPKVKQARVLIEEAKKLHGEGSHAHVRRSWLDRSASA